MEVPETLKELQTAIETMRQAYAAVRSAVEQAMGQVYKDPADATDQLLSAAEEFGPDYAQDLFSRDPHALGDVIADQDIPWTNTREMLGRDLEPMLDHHDRLDHFTSRRDALLGRENGDGKRSLNIQGVEFDLDFRAGYLREVGNPSKSQLLSVESIEPDQRSLTEQALRDSDIGKAEPTRETPGQQRGR